MRSAAESEDVGCPDPAAVEQRIESARSCRASSRWRSTFGDVWLAVAMELPYACRGRARNGDQRMDIGIYGLGRMGGNMATRLAKGGHRVVASNRSRGPVDEAVQDGGVAAYTIDELVAQLKAARVLWCMVAAADRVLETVGRVAEYAAERGNI